MWEHSVKSDADRGLIGAWARRTRLSAGFTSAEKAAAAARLAGVDIDTAYLRGIESGAHRPSREVIVNLAAVYGVSPPTAETEGDRLAALIRDAVAEGVEMALVRYSARLAEQEAPPRRRQQH